VARVRAGEAMRAVARSCRVSLCTVQRWVERAGKRRLDRVDWLARPPIAHRIRRTSTTTENLVVTLRRDLKETSDLGEYGAVAIARTLHDRGYMEIPCVRTINRILQRRGGFDARRRVRRPAPPRGWYLPPVVAKDAELDSFDIVEGLVIRGGTDVEVLTGLSLHGGLGAAWPGPPLTAAVVVERLIAHWRDVGLPAYAQFDNDTRFQGAHQHRDVVSRVMRLCLSLELVPVFAPVQDPAFQAGLENWNGRWQTKVWHRFQHASLSDLVDRSDRYVAAFRRRAAARIEAAPPRRPCPPEWALDLQTHPQGSMIFLRRTTERGLVTLLGRSFEVDPLWTHRLVRCDVDLAASCIRFHGLRRAEPEHQPLLRTTTYELPHRRFHE